MGLTGKNLDEQRELLCESAAHVYSKISKADDSFGQRLADESEDYMLKKIVKGMDGLSIQGMLWKLQKLKHASARLEDILYEELELRKERGSLI